MTENKNNELKTVKIKNTRNNSKKKEEREQQDRDELKFDLNQKLEHDPQAYIYLEYISLEYPSQTIINKSGNLLLAQCHETHSSLINLKFNNLKKNAKFKHQKYLIDCEINRLRANDQVIIGISDNKALIFNNEYEPEVEINKSFSFGLAINQTKGFFGTKKGKVLIYDLCSDKKECIQLHKKGIDAISINDNYLYTVSNDHTFKITDLRNNENIRKFENNCDVNAIDTYDPYFVIGDDNGFLHFCDIRKDNTIEKIKWHQNPINSVYFQSQEIFAGISDEQVALFDTSLESSDDWNEHKWLWFVHRGQKYYKEACLIDDIWCVTSLQGVCLFKPLNSVINEIDTDVTSSTEL